MKTPNSKNKAAEKKVTKAVSEQASNDILEIPAAGETPVIKAKQQAKKSTALTKKRVASKPAVVAESKPDEKARSSGAKTLRKPAAKASSTATSRVKKVKVDDPVPAAEDADQLVAMSPIDRLLAQPKLPELERENRARLQMQTPTRLYFYWSVRENPWALLRKAFGDDTGSYTLVLKLLELRSEAEQIYNADPEGNWWFDVHPDGEYRAEIGFYAPNRPYFRIVYSNVIETPRKKPSPRRATEADWTVTADKFANVLDVAGFSRDAVDVAIAGDEFSTSEAATRSALDQMVGGSGNDLHGVDNEDIRYAMLALAAGQKLEDLRWKISAELFAYLQANEAKLGEVNAQGALREHFDIENFGFEIEEIGPAVFGASLLNFPRTLRSRRPGLRSDADRAPVSSHSFPRPQLDLL